MTKGEMKKKLKEKDAKKSQIPQTQQTKVHPENPTVNYAGRYILKLTDERRKQLLRSSEDFFSKVSNYYSMDANGQSNSNSISSFSAVRSQLQYALEIFRDPREWFVTSPNGTTNIVDKSLRYVNHHVASSGDFLELSRIEMEHLYCIGMISAIAQCFDLCYEVIDKIQESCGKTIGIDYLIDTAFKPGPGRGHVCHKLKNIIMGEYLSPFSQRAKAMYAWVTAAHVASVCTAIATVLVDRNSSPETNGWCFSAALCILESGKWSSIASPLLLESARIAFLRGQVDESHAGVFSDLLFGASKGFWIAQCRLRRRQGNGHGQVQQRGSGSTGNATTIPSTKSALEAIENDFDDAGDPIADLAADSDEDIDNMRIESDADAEGKWAFFMEEWSKDPRGIPVCKCYPPKPTLKCMYDARSIREKSVKSHLMHVREAAAQADHERVIAVVACTIGEIHVCERLPRYRSWLRMARKEVQVLRGESLMALGRLDDAIASFNQAIDIDYMPPGAPRPVWPAAGCRRVSGYGMRAMHGSALCLYHMGKLVEARRRAEDMLVVGPQMRRNVDPNGNAEAVEDTRIDIAAWHNRAGGLLHCIAMKIAGENESHQDGGEKTTAPNQSDAYLSITKSVGMNAGLGKVEVDPTDVRGEVVVIGGAPEPITCTAQRYVWKVSGPLENSELAYKEVIVIERLQWCLIWVKSGILVWDYAKSEVVHWLTAIGFPRGSMPDLKEPEEIQCMHYVEAPIGGLLMMSTRPNTLFCVVNVDKLIRGARSSMVDALRSTLMESGVIYHPEVWLRRTSTLLGATNCYATSKSTSTGRWRMAATSRDCLGVNVFGDGQIEPGSVIGPLALMSDSPGNVLLGHDQPVCNMTFVGPTSDLLVTVCYDYIIKVWNVCRPRSNNLFSIRGYQTYVTKLCCSHHLLFTVPYPKRPTTASESSIFGKDAFEDGPFGSRNIGIWTLDTGRRIGTISVSELSMPGPVLDVVVIPRYNQIVSAHCNGELHIWKYKEEFQPHTTAENAPSVISVEISHCVCFRVLRNAQEGFSLYVHPTNRNIYVATVRSMIILHCGELSIEQGGSRKKGAIIDETITDVENKMNCGYCGKWILENSCLCSGCKRIHFCDRKCQKKGWAKHKDNCVQWTKEIKSGNSHEK